MYQSFYNLMGKPFRLSPDPAFFFPSRGHKRALAYLRYGLHQNEGFVVITGAPGTGKTTLAQILLNEMGEKNVVVAHLTTTQLEADDMLRMVSACFGLRYENLDKAALLKGIESYLLTRSRENKRALLVIDEAQNLPMRSLEELRMLSNLQVGDKALLQTFLLGQVQFRNMLENEDLEQLRQRVIANFHLGPLAADESQRYIESRLRHVGWNNDPAFAEIAFEKIHEYTEGVPRRINMLCDRILLFGCMEEQHNITGEVVDAVRAELEQEVGNARAADKPVAKSAQSESKDQNAKKNFKLNEAKPDKKIDATQSANSAKEEAYKPNSKSEAEKIQAKTQVPSKSATGRKEPKFPVDFDDAIDTDSEQFIDIKQDFIDKFDASVSRAKEAANLSSAQDGQERKKPIKQPAEPKERKSKYRAEKKAVEEEKSQEKPKEKISASVGNEEDKQFDSRSDDDVQGNTVKRKQPDVTQTKENDSHIEVSSEPAQISERDLFRVIPGGKDNRVEQQEEVATAELPNPTVSPAASAGPSTEDVVLRRILRLVLAFHRSPSSFPGLDDPSQPLPEGVSELLELAVADDEVLTKVSPAAVMGISPVMLRAAVRFFIRRTLFANDNDHYRMLGLTSKANVGDIERHYDLLMRLLRQDKQPGAAEFVDKVGRSYEALMRLDDAPQTARQVKTNLQLQPVTQTDSRSTTDEDDNKAAEVLEALENPELTIDFSDEEQSNTYQPKQKPVSAFVGYGAENYIPDPRITRRRIHLLGQAAILGFGALVVVLGIFITQLEPDNAGEQKSNAPTAASSAEIESQKLSENTDTQQEERKLGLSFNDGSSDTLRENFSRRADTEKAEKEPKVVFDAATESQKAQEKQKAIIVEETPTRKKEAIKSAAEEKPVQVASAPKSAPTPVSKFKQVPIASKDSSSKPVGNTNAGEQSKFKAVPITSKSDIEQQTVADIAQKDAQKDVQQDAQNAQQISTNVTPPLPESVSTTPQGVAGTTDKQFPGKDVPVSAASLSTTKESPIEAALSDSGSDTQEDTSTAVSSATATSPAVASSAIAINDFQLEQLLTNFSKAYEKGDINKLMSLFAKDARTNTQTTRSGIEREYKDLFNKTASRNLTLIKPLWNNEGRFARGVGQFNVTIVPQGGDPYNSNGKYTLQAYLENGRVIISRFYFSNEVTVSRAALQAGGPRQSDLKTLLADFTRYYEGGQIDNLMNLFASNARTTDQTTLSGIRKDHEDLFNSTEQRQIFLKDIQWQISESKATGKGKFEVMVQSQGQDSFASVTGTITIEVEKTGNGLKITKFLHKAN